MAKYKVEISGINTNDLEVLSNEEMIKLFQLVKEGDLQAREMLASGNLKLVLSILKRFNNKYDNMDDLFQIGCVGLMKAIDNFDLSFNVKFSTYAVPMILGEIKRYIRDNNTIRVSTSVKDIAYKTLKAKEEFINELGREPTIDELSKKLELDTLEIVNALDSLKEPVSMYEAIYNDGGDTIYLYDQIEDKKLSNNDFSSRLALEGAIDSLNEREKFILDERFVIGKTQTEIAKELDISQAQVSRLEKGAIKQLKKILK